ncbi:DUF6160 family protein [Acinetobacter lactucae]|uniref:DUF6160 family protein n=1 Tax=Acinetobacter lactucae TaxID=1785128 RepID=UPI0003DF9B83|nr:DUF6160 family protein [Acinetobacter lactucae]ETR95942.1 hypothetical protein M211_0738 [Acinetobacter lactucae]
MKKNKENHSSKFILNALTTSMLLVSGHVFALEALTDADLSAVNGQDGISIQTTFNEINIDNAYWDDHAGTSSSADQVLRAQAGGIKVQKSNASSQPLSTNYRLDVGSNPTTGKTGLDFSMQSSPSLITVNSFKVCNNSATCSPTMGQLAIQTTSPLNLALTTQDGLFNANSQSSMTLGINNANIYLGQVDARSQLNQLILRNFNFNFVGKGAMLIDPTRGLVLQTNTGTNVASVGQTPNSTYGYVDFNRVADSASGLTAGTYVDSSGKVTNSGLNIEVMLSSNVDKTNPYALDATNSPQNAKGLIRLGASGRMVNSYLQVRGMDGTSDTTILGTANTASGTSSSNSILGNSGIAFRMKGEFTKDNDSMLGSDGKATTLEIGGAGLNAYGFEFGNLTGLNSATRGYFDSGNIYLNLADTKTLLMPNNATLNAIRLGSGTLTTAADYQHNIHRDTVTNPFSLILAMRGAEFQAFSRRGRFTTSANVAAANQFADNGANNQWGLALPFYNLNANAAVYGLDAPANSAYYYTKDANGKPVRNVVATSGTTSRLGFGIAAGTTGRDATGTKTTSILLIDGSPNANNGGSPTDYYMGLRNIDMFLKGNGTIGLENGSLNVSLKEMLLALSTEIAAGYLPGAKYKTCPATGSCTSPIDNFAKNNDVLFGLKLRLGGDLNLSIVPNSSIADGSALTVLGDFTMPATATGNTVQISDPIDGSAIGFDNITGKLAFNTALVVGKDTTSGLGKVGVNTAVYFNPDKSIDGALRVKDINFYPPSTGAGARLGELAITGGRLNSSFSIVPRNGAFN